MGMNLFYLFVCVKYRFDRSKIFIPYVTAVFLMLVASFIGFYPIQDRLVQIIPIVALIVVSLVCDDISKSTFEKKQIFLFVVQFLLFVVLAYSCVLGGRNLFSSFVYRKGSEVAASIAYLNTNLTDNDIVYVHYQARAIYSYKTDYRISLNILQPSVFPFQFDKTIYGQVLGTKKKPIPYSNECGIKDNAVRQDVDIIKKYDSVYLFTSHSAVGVLNLIDVLRQYGTVETVVDSYGTRLYHFTKNKS